MKKAITLAAVLMLVSIVSFGCAPSEKKADTTTSTTVMTSESTTVTAESTTVTTKEAAKPAPVKGKHSHHKHMHHKAAM